MKTKKLLALVLAAVMLLGLLPVTAGAEGPEGQDKRTVPVSLCVAVGRDGDM